MSDQNARIIAEFHENHGKVGGPFVGKPILLLHHKGARTGTERVNPLMYQTLDGGFAVFASKGGAPTNPGWYYNLRANPAVQIEIGDETFDVRARVVESDEREPIWDQQKRDYPQFAEYEQKTKRKIPVVVLVRSG
ncbi:MAG: nitroreductase family deazaflavin-dependent oxidoreductase [Acidimicrobiales bacterium]